MGYRDSPRYQRKMQQLQADPERAHLVRSFMTEAAGADMDRQIQLAKLGYQKEGGEKRLAFGKEKLGVTGDISKAGIASREKVSDISRLARKESTLANIASREGVSEGRLGLKGDIFQAEKDRMPWEIGIAAAGVPLQYALGRREAALREEDRKIRRGFLSRGASSRNHWMNQE